MIEEGFYADKSEITNIDYLEYQFWINRLFGKSSRKYKESILDSTVWDSEDGFSHLVQEYHRNEMYHYYPVVGITLTQAQRFTKWRTDRVMELILIKSGIISPDLEQDSSQYFTFESFVNGNYTYTQGELSIEDSSLEIDFVEYKIPSSSEWESISGVNDNLFIDSLLLIYGNKAVLKKHNHLFNTKEFQEPTKKRIPSVKNSNTEKTGTVPVRLLAQNIYGMHGVVGNVSEMINEEGLSKGSN